MKKFLRYAVPGLIAMLTPLAAYCSDGDDSGECTVPKVTSVKLVSVEFKEDGRYYDAAIEVAFEGGVCDLETITEVEYMSPLYSEFWSNRTSPATLNITSLISPLWAWVTVLAKNECGTSEKVELEIAPQIPGGVETVNADTACEAIEVYSVSGVKQRVLTPGEHLPKISSGVYILRYVKGGHCIKTEKRVI